MEQVQKRKPASTLSGYAEAAAQAKRSRTSFDERAAGGCLASSTNPGNTRRKKAQSESLSWIPAFTVANAAEHLHETQIAGAAKVALLAVTIEKVVVAGNVSYNVDACVTSEQRTQKVYKTKFTVKLRGTTWTVDAPKTSVQVRKCDCAGDPQRGCKHFACTLLSIAEDSDLLGPALPDTPAPVHEHAQALVKEGIIQRTTPDQRERASRQMGDHVVPQSFKDLLAYGYLSDTYAWSPRGYMWHRTENGSELKVQDT